MVPHPSTLVFLAGQRQADYQAEAGRERLARLAANRRDVHGQHLRVRPQGLLPMRLLWQRLLPSRLSGTPSGRCVTASARQLMRVCREWWGC